VALEAASPHFIEPLQQVTQDLLDLRLPDCFDLSLQHIECAGPHQVDQPACIRQPPEKEQDLQIRPQRFPSPHCRGQVLVKARLNQDNGIDVILAQFRIELFGKAMLYAKVLLSPKITSDV